jgi:hypothetical protein
METEASPSADAKPTISVDATAAGGDGEAKRITDSTKGQTVMDSTEAVTDGGEDWTVWG